MEVIPYIFVEECEKALDFYKEILGGELCQIRKDKESNKLLHAKLVFDDANSIYFSDSMEELIYGNNATISLEFDSQEEIERVYNQLTNDGKVKSKLEKTYWGSVFAIVQDQYQVIWQLLYLPK